MSVPSIDIDLLISELNANKTKYIPRIYRDPFRPFLSSEAISRAAIPVFFIFIFLFSTSLDSISTLNSMVNIPLVVISVLGCYYFLVVVVTFTLIHDFKVLKKNYEHMRNSSNLQGLLAIMLDPRQDMTKFYNEGDNRFISPENYFHNQATAELAEHWGIEVLTDICYYVFASSHEDELKLIFAKVLANLPYEAVSFRLSYYTSLKHENKSLQKQLVRILDKEKRDLLPYDSLPSSFNTILFFIIAIIFPLIFGLMFISMSQFE